MSSKYFWLKLKKDFFKRHDIRIIESMPNGKDYILFYLKLLVESVDHEGSLRFSDTIPYNADMLAVITNTNVDIVKSALEVFINLKMIEILDDQTIYMNEVARMIGSAADNDNAIRQQRFRDNQKALKMGVLESGVTKNNATVTECVTNSNESKSKSIEIDIEKDIEKDIDIEKRNTKEKRQIFVPPTLDDIKAYCQERNSCVDPNVFYDYFTTGGWKDSEGKPVKNWKQKLITWEKHSTQHRNYGVTSGNPFDGVE